MVRAALQTCNTAQWPGAERGEEAPVVFGQAVQVLEQEAHARVVVNPMGFNGGVQRFQGEGLQLQWREARLAVHEGDYQSAETSYRALLHSSWVLGKEMKSVQAGSAAASLDTSLFLPLGAENTRDKNVEGAKEGAKMEKIRTWWGADEEQQTLRQQMEEEFVYVLLCVGEEEEALSMCQLMLERDPSNVTALKYKADALVCMRA